MIVTKENQRLYPKTWEYNAARITTELARIAENNGARVKPSRSAIISNRTLLDAKREKADRIAQLKAMNAENEIEIRTAAIKNLQKELDSLERINDEPITVTHAGYITFILDDTYYYFGVDSNPFFPFHYIKTPVKNGRYSQDACCEEDKKEWLYDCFFSWDCSDADIKEGANLIFNMLCKAPFSQIIRDSHRERVPNIYNSGYHYETVYTPERIGKIDF